MTATALPNGVDRLQFRDPAKARALAKAIERTCDQIGRTIAVMHVCGSHEQSIAKFGLRATIPKGLDVIMGPGCPVCVTDMPEVDEAVVLAQDGVVVATYGDMLRVPGTSLSLADAVAQGAKVEIVYGAAQAVELAKSRPNEQVVFFASGFETTAVATAAIVLAGLPDNLSILSAHKYIPPVMEIVSEMPGCRVEGFLAAGHAAAITGSGIFERFVERHKTPVVVAGFEPLDILAGLARLAELVHENRAVVENLFPRCVTREGNRNAQRQLWEVFRTTGGQWRGIAHVPNGNLRFRDAYAKADARQRFKIDLRRLWNQAPSSLSQLCICGDIMSGASNPHSCSLFGKECTPDNPVGACMVSNEGTCKIWHTYGGIPQL